MRIRDSFFIFLFLGCTFLSHNVFSLEATYYADGFEGGRTANGNTFSQKYHSAAICGENLGNYAYVQGGGTGLVVTLNDRPNCSLHGDVIDFSTSVFKTFAPLSKGRIYDIQASVLAGNSYNFPKKTFEDSVFSTLGVNLTRSVSNTYFAGESIYLEGKILDKKEYVMIYLEGQTDKKEYSTLIKVDANGKFAFPFTLPPTPGKYYFVLSSGNSFETTSPESIVLLDPSTFQYPEITPGILENFRPVLSESQTPSIVLPEKTWGALTVKQGKKTYRTSGTALVPPTLSLQSGTASVLIEGYNLSTPSSLDRSRDYGQIWSGTVILDRIRDTSGKNKVNIRNKKGSFTFQFRVGLGERIREEYYVTFPNGDVREYKFQKQLIGDDGYLKPGSLVASSFLAREQGVYRLETVLDNGYAHFNIPLYQGSVWSIISLFSQNERITLEKDQEVVQNYSLKRINTLRTALGRKSLVIDPTLTRIAAEKSLNMANNNYVGHWTPDGLDILAFAKSLGLPYPNTISENVAGGNVSHMVLQDGLEESGSHRHSMINPEWTKVGIGYTVKNKKGYLVQVFSE